MNTFGTNADARKPAEAKRPPVMITGLFPNLVARTDDRSPEIRKGIVSPTSHKTQVALNPQNRNKF